MTQETSPLIDRRALFAVAAGSAALAAPSVAAQNSEPPAPRPPRAVPTGGRYLSLTDGGFSRAGLERMRATMGRHVESGRVPGLVTLISRRGETHVDAFGKSAFGSSTPMRRDTIFRIASMTKPITAAAAMMLVEEGKLRLDDPVDSFLPELANRRVLRSLESALDDTVPANRSITLRDLLTFRAGIGAIMVFPPKYPIQQAMTDAGVSPGPFLLSLPPDEIMKRYGSLPLAHQPGEKWLYDSGSNILGVLIARASGKSFGAFLSERIFQPLGMKDTGFSVPASKIDRLPVSYTTGGNPSGPLAVFDEGRGGRFASPPVFESGSGGLVSTVDDYLAFCRMMLNKGAHGRDRLLSRPAVELMTTDHITPEQKAVSPFGPGFWDSRGWGFGLSVNTRRDELWSNPGRFGWDGGYGTSAYSDPKEDLVGILMTQRMMDSPAPPPTFVDFWTSAYQAIGD